MNKIVVFLNGERGRVVLRALVDAGYMVCDEFNPGTMPHLAYFLGVDADLFVVAGFPIRFSKELLGVPKHGTINCHAGPVPNYRGGSPLNWQIINGEEILRVSLLKMDEGLDTGPVLSSQAFRLEPHETIADAHRKANIAFAEMVVAHVWMLENSPETIAETPQEFYAGIRPPKTWPQRNDDMGEIDPCWSAKRIVNKVRALTRPYPGAWIAAEDGRRVRIWDASL